MNKKTIAMSLGLLVAWPVHAENATSAHLQFVLDAVAKRNFTGCEKAIRTVFKPTEGDDLRVTTGVTEETKADSLKITAVFGYTGDAAVVEVVLRRVGRACVVNQTVITTTPTSCTAFLVANPVWKLESDTVGVLSASSSGGVNMRLMPLGKGCVQVTQTSFTE